MSSLPKVIVLLLCFAFVVQGFAPSPLANHLREGTVGGKSTELLALPVDTFEGTSTTIAAATLDPTTFLSDLLGAFVNSNAILAVPIVAALALASLVAFAIVAYANPAEPEDD